MILCDNDGQLERQSVAGTDGGWTAAAMVLFPVSLLAGSGLGVPLSQLAA